MGYKDSNGHYWELDDAPRLTLAQLKTADLRNEPDGVEVRLDNGLTYKWVKDSVLDGDDVFVIVPDEGRGRFLLAPGSTFDIAIPISYANTDAERLVIAPTNSLLAIGRCYWEVTADFTGGTASAIGISSDAAPHSTKGDILGGSGGDVAATLVASAGKQLGTVGADYAGGILIHGGDSPARFDRITDAFTAGTGFFHLVGQVLANPGA